MTGMEHEANGSWLVPLLLLAAVCWQVWVTLRHTPPPDRDADADEGPATAWPFPVDLAGLSHHRQPVAATPTGPAPPQASPFASALRHIRDHDHGFDLEQFLQGAQAAYETIAVAFARGDRATLRPLVAPEVYDDYTAAIAARARTDETTRRVLVRLAEPELLDIATDAGHAAIRLRFLGTWLSVRAPAEAPPDDAFCESRAGAANATFDTEDEWTFTRPLTARNPNWVLAASNEA